MSENNVIVCPYCGYKFLFPPAEVVWLCPVCGGTVNFLREEERERKSMFTNDELNLIHEDQVGMLESIHNGFVTCEDLSECPPQHFGCEDIEDIFIRQEIVKKIQKVNKADDIRLHNQVPLSIDKLPDYAGGVSASSGRAGR